LVGWALAAHGLVGWLVACSTRTARGARPAPRGTMPCRECAQCGAEFPCAPSFRGKVPRCSGCRGARGGRQHGTAPAGSAPKTGAAGAPQPRHMTPCACHCAACRAAGHGGKHGMCVVLCAGLHDLFDGGVADLTLRHYYGACGWGTARFDAAIDFVQYGPPATSSRRVMLLGAYTSSAHKRARRFCAPCRATPRTIRSVRAAIHLATGRIPTAP